MFAFSPDVKIKNFWSSIKFKPNNVKQSKLNRPTTTNFQLVTNRENQTKMFELQGDKIVMKSNKIDDSLRFKSSMYNHCKFDMEDNDYISTTRKMKLSHRAT